MAQTPSYLKSLKKESVVQSVINCLTDAIRSEELKPGDRIPPEPELADSLGVARSSVREAIKILTYLGVLESKRSEGTFVCNGYKESMIDPMVYGILLNQDSFENLMELREMTEAGMLLKHQASDSKYATYQYVESSKCLTHFHFECKNCGVVVALDNKETNEFVKMVKNILGFTVDPQNTYLTGTCKKCGERFICF